LLVRLALGGVGKEEAHLPRLGHGQGVILVHDGLPARLGIDAQAVLETQRDIEALAQLLPELGGDEQATLGVYVMSVFSDHRVSPRSIFIYFTPSCSTWLYYTRFAKKLQSLSPDFCPGKPRKKPSKSAVLAILEHLF